MIATRIGTQSSTSHPPIPYWFRVIPVDAGILDGFPLAFSNRWTMEILLAVGKTKANRLNMAGKANQTTMLDWLILFFLAIQARKTHQ